MTRPNKKKKLWNMKETIVLIVIDAFGTVTKRLLKRLEEWEVGERVETILTTTLLRTARILRRGWILEETCCHSMSCEKPSADIDVKNSNGDNNNHKINKGSKLVQKITKLGSTGCET